MIPIVVITGQSDDKNHLKALEAGADDFLAKPFNMNFLKARLKSLLSVKILYDMNLEYQETLKKSNIELMQKFGFSGFPVVENSNLLVGIVTHRDLRFKTNLKLLVKEVMTHDPVTACDGISVENALKILDLIVQFGTDGGTPLYLGLLNYLNPRTRSDALWRGRSRTLARHCRQSRHVWHVRDDESIQHIRRPVDRADAGDSRDPRPSSLRHRIRFRHRPEPAECHCQCWK